MKRDNYTGEFDEFDVPSDLWNKVEAHLDEEEQKRRGFIWWKTAGVLILVLGIGSILTYNSFTGNKNYTSKNEPFSPSKPVKKTNKTEPVQLDDTIEIIPIKEKKEPEYYPSGSQIIPFTQNSGYGSGAGSGASGGVIGLTGASPATYAWTTVSGGTSAVLGLTTNATFTVTATNSNACSGTAINLGYTGDNLLFTSRRNTFDNGTPSNGNSSGIDGGPTFGFSNGIIDGVYIQEQIPTKRLIPYEELKESENSDLWITETEVNNGSTYDAFVENDYLQTYEAPLSTFSIDVDGASYSDVRGMINRNELPNKNCIRIEEFVNYFPYSYEEPTGEHPFSIHSEVGICPWNTEHSLLKIGIKGKSIEKAQLPKNNLVFLLDVSGSMEQPEKIELLKKGFRLLVKEMREEDRISICVYAGAAGVVLPPTSGANKDQILDALNNLSAGGSTAGGEGIELAYALAAKNFIKDGNNRVILATDGDFNVGLSDDDALVKLIEEKRESGVFLTVLGFGHDNFQSSKMEKLANNGNGNFSFIDNILEAKKVLVTEMGATLQTIAKDVKIQLEFNPEFVSSYRLIGYENRLLQNEDFSNDTIDAGELGAGHTVTAIYEIIPANGSKADLENKDGLKYSQVSFDPNGQFKNELATMKFRYKQADGTTSQLIEQAIPLKTETVSDDFEFIQAVVEFGLILRNSNYAGTANYDAILKRAQEAKGDDPYGYRNEFILLVEKAKLLSIVN